MDSEVNLTVGMKLSFIEHLDRLYHVDTKTLHVIRLADVDGAEGLLWNAAAIVARR